MQVQISKGLLSPNQMVRYVSFCTLRQLLKASSSVLENVACAKRYKCEEANTGKVSVSIS